MLIII